MKTESLSDSKYTDSYGRVVYPEEDVKEAVKDFETYLQEEYVMENVTLSSEQINVKILRIINKIKKRVGSSLI